MSSNSLGSAYSNNELANGEGICFHPLSLRITNNEAKVS